MDLGIVINIFSVFFSTLRGLPARYKYRQITWYVFPLPFHWPFLKQGLHWGASEPRGFQSPVFPEVNKAEVVEKSKGEMQVLEQVIAIFGTRWSQEATDLPLLQPHLGHQHTRDRPWGMMNLTSWEWYPPPLIYPSSLYAQIHILLPINGSQ